MSDVNDWAELATGESGDIDLERAWLRKAQEIFTVFCEKQSDYGPANIGVGGLKGLAQRVVDKTSRLWTLTGMSADGSGNMRKPKTGESLRDTLLDLADYGIIGMMLFDGDWQTIDIDEYFNVKTACTCQ